MIGSIHLPTFRWWEIRNMAQKRFRATSVSDERGDLWVMGGSRGDSTIQADDKWVHLFDSDGNDKV